MSTTVLFVTDSLSIGGAELQLYLLITNLPHVWIPILISLSDGPMRGKYEKAGIEVIRIERKFRFDGLTPFIRIDKLITRYYPSIVHTWGWMSTMTASLALTSCPIPHISNNVRMGMVPANAKILHKLACRLGDVAVANSYAGLDSWPIPRKKGCVIYNGFDWNRVRFKITNLQTEEDVFRIIMIASMSPLKDWEAYLSTVRYLLKNREYPDIVFHGFGSGTQRNMILNAGEDLLKDKNIFLPGYTANPIQECMQADVGVLLSPFGEGISNSIMEYMACGLPVICSDSGGNPELVIEGVTGFLVDPTNPPKQIAEKIIWLKDNPDKAKEMGIAGRERIRNHFGIERMVKGYIESYSALLNIRKE